MCVFVRPVWGGEDKGPDRDLLETNTPLRPQQSSPQHRRRKQQTAKMCCSGFLKIMMFIFNGAIFLAGVAILAVGVWVKVDSGSLLGVLDNIKDAPAELGQLANVAYLLMGVGGVLLIMGFLGCCGAMKESRCMLMLFFIIILIIFIAEVAGCVVVLVFQPLAKEVLEDLSEKIVARIKKDYGKDESLTSLWNGTMEQFKCCGYRNYTDFDGSPFQENSTNSMYPPTCCSKTGTCAVAAAKTSNVIGCFTMLLNLIEDNAVIIGAVGLGIAALEIAAMVVSMVLYQQIGNK
ncbi:tetraspanin-1-like [Salvelinus alpinus]|uniref:tetraspanin-1-like n=1 Tax=Salvelinus alpinus TaxID=8036 RepID=UPI0039FC06F4